MIKGLSDNWRTAIGYICIALVFISWFGMFYVLALPDEFTFKLEMDNNTKDAFESINYSAINNIEQVCYSEKCYLDLENNTIGGCSMYKVDCKLWEDKYGFALSEDSEVKNGI